MATDPSLITSAEGAADHLYGLAASDFIAARDGLVRSLRAAGQRDLATEVKSLRRPSLLAAQLNQALRADRSALERLLDAAATLRQGHHRLVAGDAVDLASLQSAHRAATHSVAAQASRDHDTLAEILERASLDDTTHPGLRTATYATPPEVAVGFDLVGSLPPPPPGTDHPLSAPPGLDDAVAPTRSTPLRSVPSSPHRVVDAVALVYEEAVRAEALAARRVVAGSEAADWAARRVEEMEERLAEARSHQLESEQKLEQARAAAERAATNLVSAAGELERARRDMDRASSS